MADFRDRKTPGVHVTDTPAYPPSAVGVDTAIPAFVGYTERAAVGGRPAFGTPISITSIDEYHTYFGGAAKSIFRFDDGTEQDFDVKFAALDVTGKADADSIQEVDAHWSSGSVLPKSSPFLCQRRRPLFRRFGRSVRRSGRLEDARSRRARARGPGRPDHAARARPVAARPGHGQPVGRPGFRDVAVAMLNQCQKKQDRVALLDVVHAQSITRTSSSQDLASAIEQFRADVDHEFRSYGIAYFPHLDTSIVRPTDLD